MENTETFKCKVCGKASDDYLCDEHDNYIQCTMCAEWWEESDLKRDNNNELLCENCIEAGVFE